MERNGEDIYADWAGPWLMVENQNYGTLEGKGPIGLSLFLDYYGDLFDAGTFFIAMRRYVAAEGGGGLLGQMFGRPARQARGWDNGEVVGADRDVVLLVPCDAAEVIVQALQTYVACAHTYDIPGAPVQRALLDAAQVDVDGQDWPAIVELRGYPHGSYPLPGADQYLDGTPTESGASLVVTITFSEYTQNHPWEMSVTDANGLACGLQSLLTQRRAYLHFSRDMTVRIERWRIEDADPDVYDANAVVETLEQDAAQLAEAELMAGWYHVRITFAGYLLADFGIDELTEEEHDRWLSAYGQQDG